MDDNGLDGMTCPITQVLFLNPVICVEDGHTCVARFGRDRVALKELEQDLARCWGSSSVHAIMRQACSLRYERDAIEDWWNRGNRTSPATGAVLSNLQTIPNHALRKTVQDLVDKARLPATARGGAPSRTVCACALPTAGHCESPVYTLDAALRACICAGTNCAHLSRGSPASTDSSEPDDSSGLAASAPGTSGDSSTSSMLRRRNHCCTSAPGLSESSPAQHGVRAKSSRAVLLGSA